MWLLLGVLCTADVAADDTAEVPAISKAGLEALISEAQTPSDAHAPDADAMDPQPQAMAGGELPNLQGLDDSFAIPPAIDTSYQGGN
jgi:hypothetical protein